ncbi:MAG TPA: hypothetical protein VL498_06350, partial [Terracidiphilus sp.]|nr:hypothetical protein [Terracidiphilus sp.]
MHQLRLPFSNHLLTAPINSIFPLAVTLFITTLPACTQQTPQTMLPPAAQTFPLTSANALAVTGGKAEPVEYLGRRAVLLTTN